MSQIILRHEKLFHTEAGVSGQISITFLMNCVKLWHDSPRLAFDTCGHAKFCSCVLKKIKIKCKSVTSCEMQSGVIENNAREPASMKKKLCVPSASHNQ